MKRRKLLKAMAALAITERLGVLQAAWAAGQKLPPPGMQRFTGDVKVNGQPAREGMLINPGDSITTGRNSQAIYVIGEDAYLQRDNSLVTITGDSVKRGLRILSGKLMSVFAKGEKQIQTSTATIGIRGTGCYIEAGADKVYFCLCYGVAEVSSLKTPAHKEVIETSHHDHPVYLHDSGESMMVPAGMINHTDSELILLENLVGRVPPFYGKYGSYY